MTTKRFVWGLRLVAFLVFCFGLLFWGFSVAYAEEAPAEPAVEEQVSEPDPEPASEPEVSPSPLPRPELEPDLDPEPEPAPAPVQMCGNVACDSLPPAEERGGATTSSGYTPPAEALDGLGAWSVVSPSTGKVYTTVPLDGRVWSKDFIEGWESRNGARFCADCTLRFQADSSSSGNVAGYGGSSASYDGDQKGTYTVKSGSTTATLVPEKTLRSGGNISAGLTNIRTRDVIITDKTSAIVETQRDDKYDQVVETTITLPDLSGDGTILTYGVDLSNQGPELSSVFDLIESNVEIIVEAESRNFPVVENPNEEPEFVSTIKEVTSSVISFLKNLFGFGD